MTDLLSTLGLSADAIAARKNCIGGSDANAIMGGDPTKLLKLWREKRGEAPGDDLSDVLAVQMGSFTERLNIAWFEKQTGFVVTHRGFVLGTDATQAPEPWMNCTLDGMTDNAAAVFEAKHVGTRSTDDEVFARYVPQLTHNCLCAGVESAFLSAFKGNGDWAMWEYALDANYAEALVAAERDFWRHVQDSTPPAPLPLPPAPKPVGVKEYSMEQSNAWAIHASVFRETLLPADRHESAKKEIKGLVPDDASKCVGHGLTVKRAKNGALRISVEG